MNPTNLIEGRTASGTAYLTQGRAGGTVLAISHGWQDSPLAWLDWDLVNENAELLRFCRLMIQFRKQHPALMPV